MTGNSATEDLNEGIGEGSAYRGRLLMSITTSIIDGEGGGAMTVKKEKLLQSGGLVCIFTMYCHF